MPFTLGGIMIKVFFNRPTNVAWIIRVVTNGQSYGLNNCLKHDRDDPLVEFHDSRYELTDLGQFVSRYYLSTLLKDCEQEGLLLDTGSPNWIISPCCMKRIRDWLLDVRVQLSWTRPLSLVDISGKERGEFNPCRILRDAFFGENKKGVFSAIPDLPSQAFGAGRCKLLIPFAERFGLIPEGVMDVPDGATHYLINISNDPLPKSGAYTTESMPIPSGVTLGDWTLKEEILSKCLIAGSRYGSCWFAGFL